MRMVTKQALNQNAAAVLREVTAAEDVVVTDDGPLSRLKRAGLYTPPATEPAPWLTAPAEPAYTAEQVAALLEDSRGDR